MTKTIEQRLDQVSDGLRAAVTTQQQDGDPAHEDFYAWGWALSDLTARIEDAARVLGRQVSAYGDRRILRDDEDGVHPANRLDEARGYLDDVARFVSAASAAARKYHSAIGHVGVEVDPGSRR